MTSLAAPGKKPQWLVDLEDLAKIAITFTQRAMRRVTSSPTFPEMRDMKYVSMRVSMPCETSDSSTVFNLQQLQLYACPQ
jgi:hypothetical protein